MNTIKLNVEGMKCEGCETRIKNSLKQLDNFFDVTCSHEKGEVIISSTNDINIHLVKEAIEDLGFKVKED